MRNFKKFAALLLGAMLTVSAVVPAFAETTVTITNGQYDDEYYTKGADEIKYSAHNYTAAQILAATGYEKDTGKYTGLSWGAQVTSPDALLSALQDDDTWGDVFEDYVVDAADVENDHPQFTAASFAAAISDADTDEAKALAQVLKGLYAGEGTAISGSSAVTLPGIGYYLIDDVTEDLTDDAANPVVLFAGPGSNYVRIKTDKPSQDKEVYENSSKADWNEVSDYYIGDAVPFKITSKVPNFENYDKYVMTFTDEMSDGLTLYDYGTPFDVEPTNITLGAGESLAFKVTVDGNDITNDAAVDFTDLEHGFTLELILKEDADSNAASWAVAGKDIVITFYGVLNDEATIGLDGNTNKSKLEYSNNPDDDTSTTETPWDTVIVFTYELDVNKIDGATEEVLPGAQFALQATSGEHEGKWVIVDQATGKVVGWQDAAPAADNEDDSDGYNALLTSDDEGNFKVIGLDDGTYTLKEVKAPAGYNTITDITITITAGTVHTADGESAAAALTSLAMTIEHDNAENTTADGNINSGIVSAKITNNSGATLPETGGVGTTLFYVIGAILVLGAAILLVTKRRVNAQ